MLRANSGVWVTALGEETVKNCHVFDPVRWQPCLSHGGVWQFRSRAPELSTTQLLSEQHESTPLWVGKKRGNSGRDLPLHLKMVCDKLVPLFGESYR